MYHFKQLCSPAFLTKGRHLLVVPSSYRSVHYHHKNHHQRPHASLHPSAPASRCSAYRLPFALVCPLWSRSSCCLTRSRRSCLNLRCDRCYRRCRKWRSRGQSRRCDRCCRRCRKWRSRGQSRRCDRCCRRCRKWRSRGQSRRCDRCCRRCRKWRSRGQSRRCDRCCHSCRRLHRTRRRYRLVLVL